MQMALGGRPPGRRARDSGLALFACSPGVQCAILWGSIAEIGNSARLLLWSVPAGRGHDDLLVSAARSARLDGVDWRARVTWGRA